MVIIVGLGNPEARYEHTNHNIGFDVVDMLAKKWEIEISKKKFKALVGEGMIDGQKVMIVKPQTYMNNSGECVVMLKEKFKDARIIVVVDDIDLPRGYVRYREKGSAGTHNGLRSIVSFIGEDFERVKVGTGRDISVSLVDFVLSKYDQTEMAPVLQRACQEIEARI